MDVHDIPKVYDLNMNLVAYLENATTIGYEQPIFDPARFHLVGIFVLGGAKSGEVF